MDDTNSTQTSNDDGRTTGETNYEPVGENGDSEGTGTDSESDQGEAIAGADTGGESTTSDGTSADAGQDIQSPGDGVDESAETFEAVSSEQFSEAIEAIDSKVDALNASTIVLVFALFLCAGILSVSTLVRSMEWR